MSDKRLTPCKAIKEYCISHCNGKDCEDIQCPLYRFRRGNNPNRKEVRPRRETSKQGILTPCTTVKRR